MEDIFRRSRPVLVASLTRTFGPARLDLVESVVQDAFLRAMTEWAQAVPENPDSWLHRVAKNLALDAVRRERVLSAKEEGVRHFIEEASIGASTDADAAFASELPDDQITMIFVACHPCNTVPSQVVLALRTLCGLEVPAIARAIFATPEAVEKRLVLARRRVREEGVSFDLPAASELGSRLEAVLRVLYLTFNEAYWATSGAVLVQEDVALESIRLVSLLADNAATTRSDVFALLALMYFQASRFAARTDEEGIPVPLPEQDRSRWSAPAIDAGLRALAASARGDEATSYHFEAAIAAIHATSRSHEDTDWGRIVGFYDQLIVVNASPVARLGRAVALGFAESAEEGLRDLDVLGADLAFDKLASYHAARAEALARLDRTDEASTAFARALERATQDQERRYFERRAARLLAGSS